MTTIIAQRSAADATTTLYADQLIVDQATKSKLTVQSKIFNCGSWGIGFAGMQSLMASYEISLERFHRPESTRDVFVMVNELHKDATERGLLEWYSADGLLDARCSLLVVTSEHVWVVTNNHSILGQSNRTFSAIGSGAKYAQGAIWAGATPKDAIMIAGHLDPSTSEYCEEVVFGAKP